MIDSRSWSTVAKEAGHGFAADDAADPDSDREASDREGFGLRPDGVGEVDDPEDEVGDGQVGGYLLFEAASIPANEIAPTSPTASHGIRCHDEDLARLGGFIASTARARTASQPRHTLLGSTRPIHPCAGSCSMPRPTSTSPLTAADAPEELRSRLERRDVVVGWPPDVASLRWPWSTTADISAGLSRLVVWRPFSSRSR